MHIPSLIDLLRAMQKDINKFKDSDKYKYTRVWQDLREADIKIDELKQILIWAERHRREVSK